jgi:hypothetical protein
MKLEDLRLRDGEGIVRIFDFDTAEAGAFRTILQREILEAGRSVEVAALHFVEPVNCTLLLTLDSESTGITPDERGDLVCRLTRADYEQMVGLVTPFCNGPSDGYQWLYELLVPIELLFSPGGSW